MTSCPSPDSRLLGLFFRKEVRLLHAAFLNTLLDHQSPARTILILAIENGLSEFGPAERWGVDWRDLRWRLRSLDEAGAKSLVMCLAREPNSEWCEPAVLLKEATKALNARPAGVGVVLAYECGHREGDEASRGARKARLCQVGGQCPTCALAEFEPAAVQAFGDVHPRDMLTAMRIRSRVVAFVTNAPAPTPDDTILNTVLLRYFLSLYDPSWWAKRELTVPQMVARYHEADAILNAATREEAEVLLRSSDQALRELALRRIAGLSAE